MNDGTPDGYWWFPGNARHDRGYTREEALAAVGQGWAPLVEQAWTAVQEANGEIMQVKQKFGALTIYAYAPPEQANAMRDTLASLAYESKGICEWCGKTGEGSTCESCRESDAWERHDLASHKQWISHKPREDRPDWVPDINADWKLFYETGKKRRAAEEDVLGVQRGLESMRAGRGKPLDAAFDSLRDKLRDIPSEDV